MLIYLWMVLNSSCNKQLDFVLFYRSPFTELKIKIQSLSSHHKIAYFTAELLPQNVIILQILTKISYKKLKQVCFLRIYIPNISPASLDCNKRLSLAYFSKSSCFLLSSKACSTSFCVGTGT